MLYSVGVRWTSSPLTVTRRQVRSTTKPPLVKTVSVACCSELRNATRRGSSRFVPGKKAQCKIERVGSVLLNAQLCLTVNFQQTAIDLSIRHISVKSVRKKFLPEHLIYCFFTSAVTMNICIA